MGKHIQHTINIGRDKNILSMTLSVQVSAETPRVFSIVGDEAQWPENLVPRILKRQPNERLLVAFPDLSRAELIFNSTEAGCEIVIAHELIKSEGECTEYQTRWTNLFDQVQARVCL